MKKTINHITGFFIFLFLILFCSLKGYSQDIHFSQFRASPMNLNPALAGNFVGDMRLTANYRRQWESVTIPFQTFGVSADVNGQEFFNIPSSGAGISIYNDIAGDSRFNTFQINFAGSYTLPFNRKYSKYISIGMQAGFTQQSINTSKLRFDQQYRRDGGYDPTLATGEDFEQTTRLYPNINMGMYYHHKFNDYQTYNIGLSLFNINKPQQSYLPNPESGLDRRFNLHFDGNIFVKDDLDFQPALLFMNQGTYFEFTAGGSFKYSLDKKFKKVQRYLYGGLYTRVADAAYLQVGYEHDNWRIGFSYDFNYSGLVPASRGLGGPEISFTYILDALFYHREHYQICPEFL